MRDIFSSTFQLLEYKLNIAQLFRNNEIRITSIKSPFVVTQ